MNMNIITSTHFNFSEIFLKMYVQKTIGFIYLNRQVSSYPIEKVLKYLKKMILDSNILQTPVHIIPVHPLCLLTNL